MATKRLGTYVKPDPKKPLPSEVSISVPGANGSCAEQLGAAAAAAGLAHSDSCTSRSLARKVVGSWKSFISSRLMTSATSREILPAKWPH